jgi:hypothetical protein
MIVIFLFGGMVYILFEVMVYIFSTTPCRVEASVNLILHWANWRGIGWPVPYKDR